MALALVVRIPRLTESLWYDEIAAYIRFVTLEHPGPIASNFFDISNHIAHTLCSWITVYLFGNALGRELAVRIPAALFSLLSVWSIYRLILIPFGQRAALVGALLMAILPVSVLEGVEARGYSMMIFFTTTSTLALLSAHRHDRPWLWWVYGLLCTLGIWSHLLTIFVPIGHMLTFTCLSWYKRHWSSFGKCLTALVGAAVMTLTLYAPALPDLLAQSTGFEKTTDTQPGIISGQGLLAILQLGGSWYPWASLPGLILVLIGIRYAKKVSPRVDSMLVLGLLWLGWVVFLVAIPAFGLWIYARYMLFILCGAVVLMTWGIEQLFTWHRAAGISALAMVCCFSIADLTIRPPKQPLREAMAYVHDHRQPGETGLAIGLRHKVLYLYARDFDLVFSLKHGIRLKEKLDATQPTWIIMLYPNHVSQNRKKLLSDRGFELIKNFEGWSDWGKGGDVLIFRKNSI